LHVTVQGLNSCPPLNMRAAPQGGCRDATIRVLETDQAMRLDRISVKGYKSIRELDLSLRSLNVMIGANGAGKTNLISLFRLLNQMVAGDLQNAIATAGGAETFLHFGSKTTPGIELTLTFGQNGYHCIWSPSADDSLFFRKEDCIFSGTQYKAGPHRESLGSGHRESRLREAVEQWQSKVPRYVLDAFGTWRLYHFHDTSESAPVKKRGEINDNVSLRPDAGNLAAFLFLMKAQASGHYLAIRDTIRQVAPFFDDFILRPDPANETRIQLEWREQGSDYPFMAHHLSDGTLRFICLATLLLQPTLPSTVVIDEPELGLHPLAITMLASLLKSASTRTQVIVATQSVPLVNQLQPEDILVVDRVERQSTFRQLEAQQIQDWLDDYGLGDLWEKNLIGGRP
jgi:predicted ATPase